MRGRGKAPRPPWPPWPSRPLEAFVFWVLAFWSTAMAYVFEARGQVSLALLMIAVAVAYLVPLCLPPRTSSRA